MLNVSLYRAAPRAHARLFGLAACTWTAWVPAHAAEPPSAEKIFTASFKPYQGWRDKPLQDGREAPPGGNVEVTVRKPAGHAGHH